MSYDLEQLESSANRLECYARRVSEKICAGKLYDAMADVAEAGEIARRLWHALAAIAKLHRTAKR